MQVDKWFEIWTCVQTCIGWPNRLQSLLIGERKYDTSCAKKNIPMLLLVLQFSTRSKQQNLHWLALGSQTVKNLNVSTFTQIWSWPKVNVSCCKSTQVCKSPGQTKSKVDVSCQLDSHHQLPCQCIDIVWRNYTLIACKSCCACLTSLDVNQTWGVEVLRVQWLLSQQPRYHTVRTERINNNCQLSLTVLSCYGLHVPVPSQILPLSNKF